MRRAYSGAFAAEEIGWQLPLLHGSLTDALSGADPAPDGMSAIRNGFPLKSLRLFRDEDQRCDSYPKSVASVGV